MRWAKKWRSVGDPSYHSVVSEPVPKILFVNTYTKTGIGDFGLQSLEYLQRHETVTVMTTVPDGKQLLSGLLRILRWPGPLIANVGLTTWGRRGIANFLGFATMGIRAAIGRPIIVMLHNVIEIIVPEDSGYEINGLTKFGAHLAVRLLRGAKIVVFSEQVLRILERDYGLRVQRCTPLPCTSSGLSSNPEDIVPSSEPIAVTVGYLAPYKGLPVFVGARKFVDSSVKMTVVGGLHRLLESKPQFSQFATDAFAIMRGRGIDYRGYLPEIQLKSLLQGHVVGVLSYTSLSGASAAFSLFASSGVPVVATDLSEFKYLKELGAGIVLVSASPQQVGDAINNLFLDGDAWLSASRSQRAFASKYSWTEFTDWLLALVKDYS